MESDFKRISLEQEGTKRKGKKSWGKGKRWYLGILLTCFIVGGFLWFLSTSTARHYDLPNPIKVLQGNSIRSDNNRVNILLLGNSGANHDGPLLTDSIIVVSYNLKTDKAVLISIPRDLWLGSIKAKVNAAYEKGVKEKKGLEFSRDKLSEVVGLPIHYAIRVDFGAFEKAIDLVEGIEIEIPRSFDDYNYPIPGKENDLCGNKEEEIELTEEQAKLLNTAVGKKKVILTPDNKIASTSADFACRYERLSFKKGKTVMDGETALKFVRSRMGTNGEGSDFARSRRQQLVIEAFRKKALSAETIFNPGKLVSLWNTFGKSVETDIPTTQFLEFYKLSKEIKQTDSVVLGDLGDGKSLFINPPSSQYGAWVLIPPEEDWTVVADHVRNVLENQR